MKPFKKGINLFGFFPTPPKGSVDFTITFNGYHGQRLHKTFLSTNHKAGSCNRANHQAGRLSSKTTVFFTGRSRDSSWKQTVYHDKNVLFNTYFNGSLMCPNGVYENENPGFTSVAATGSPPRTGDYTYTCSHEEESQQNPTGYCTL